MSTWLEFILAMASVLAWPAAIVTILVLLSRRGRPGH